MTVTTPAKPGIKHPSPLRHTHTNDSQRQENLHEAKRFLRYIHLPVYSKEKD